jgi:hypothetical protein
MEITSKSGWHNRWISSLMDLTGRRTLHSLHVGLGNSNRPWSQLSESGLTKNYKTIHGPSKEVMQHSECVKVPRPPGIGMEGAVA